MSMIFLSHEQVSLVTEILDQLIPNGDGFPGAGELGIAQHIDEAAGNEPKLRRLFLDGFNSIDITSFEMYSSGFSDLVSQQKIEVLKEVESRKSTFFKELVKHTYAGYYTNRNVIELLGLEARPPQPLGFELEPFDPSLLENVKKRGKMYRDA